MAATDPSEHPSTDDERLPAGFDRLVPIGQLVHGQHNPRRETPSPALQRSVANHGIEHPLIVHQPDDGMYHIIDGWQRYQAAVDVGWEQLPVNICETAAEAIRQAERESLGKDYSVYHWAQLCWSYATKIGDGTIRDVARQVAKQLDNARSVQTVTRYLRVLSLPGEIHPLLIEGPTGTDQDWQALRTHNPDIRRYDGLSWVVAHELAKHRTDISEQRLLGIAANAVVFDDRSMAKEFVRRAVEETEHHPETVLRQIQLADQPDGTVTLPQLVVSLSPAEKEALLTYLHQTRTPLPEFLRKQVHDLAETALDGTGS